ncbi:LOW QUALITY PROTEIN: calcium-activated chloride channel regulator 1-like [Leptodactylus fuscus]
MALRMRLCLAAVIFLFQVISPVDSSMIKLTDGGYEDIVIAINPGLPENVQIIEKIKAMLNEATHYLYNATQNRLFIRSAKILLPMTWTKGNYSKRKTETYDKADVIVANPYLKYGEDPYTLQYGSCGEPARYIHFTPNFLLDDNLLSVYGPRGRVFVHEWAHLRWGVYDEYNLEKPYYVSMDLKVEATRCSLDILGINVKRTDQCQGSSCKVRPCSFDYNTGLYEEGCMFLPENNPYVKQSIMYLQALPYVSEFCNSSNHNIEAPTLQNRMCNSHSTWDIIRNSTDINSTEPMENSSIPLPSISVIQFKDKVVTLVLDVSGSMAGDRITRLYQAAEIFVIQILEAGSYVGIVTFESSATIKTQLLQIKSDVDRAKLKSFLPRTASGGTNICVGILAGIEVNRRLDNSSHGTDIILLSDGEDNYDPTRCFPNIYESGVVISFINLGPNWVRSLKNVIDKTGGSQYSASENFAANGLIDAFNGISFGNGDISQQSIQLESTASILNASGCLNGSVFIDRTVGNNTFFVVTWQTTAPTINLKDPKGKIYTQANFTSDTTSKSSRLAIPGTAEIGQDYSLCNTLASRQALGVIVSSKAADGNLPPITVDTHMNTVTNAYPNPMIVYAAVSQGLLPVKGAKVTAIIEPASGTPETLELLDNGAGADIMKNDGVYSRYFTAFRINGRYNLKVRVQGVRGKSRLAVRSSRALYLPGYVDNGVVMLNSPRPEVNDDDLNLGEFSRIASGGAFDVSNIPSNIPQDLYRPDKITDLYGTIKNGSIVLSWTATGDDLDQGTATSYDLRMSTSPKDLRDNFYGSSSVNMSRHTPLPAGSTETFTFQPENIVIANGTILYFALVAIDKTSQNSDISNIAQAALFIPPAPVTTPTPKPNNNKIDAAAVTAISSGK